MINGQCTPVANFQGTN